MAWPAPVSFDPTQRTTSPAVEALLEAPGSHDPVLLLAVGPLAQRGGWAAQSALAIAEALSARGEQVILADLSLQQPELHQLFGSDNEEGLTDVFLFGASLEHISRSVPDRPFRLIAASPFTPDAREVLEHERWSVVFEALAQQPAKLVVYLPVDVPGAQSFSDRVGHTVVLADPSELDSVAYALSADADVICVLHAPDAVVPEPPVEAEAPAEPEPAPAAEAPATLERLDDSEFEKIRIPRDGAREALIADLRARQRAALMAPAPQLAPLPVEESMPAARPRPKVVSSGEPRVFRIPVAQPQQPKPRRTQWVVALVAVLLLLGAAGYWAYNAGLLRRPEPVPVTRAPAAQPAPVSAPVAAPTSPDALRFSVAVASYPVLGMALEQQAQLAKADNGTAFYIALNMLQGQLFYTVLAGLFSDSAAAVALRDSLMARRIKTVALARDVWDAPWAFLLGVYDGRGAAEATRRSAQEQGIPTYIVEARDSADARQYKVYAGAFAGRGEAEFLRPILSRSGFPDNLAERTGSIR